MRIPHAYICAGHLVCASIGKGAAGAAARQGDSAPQKVTVHTYKEEERQFVRLVCHVVTTPVRSTGVIHIAWYDGQRTSGPLATFILKRQHTPRGADNRQSPEQGQHRTEPSTDRCTQPKPGCRPRQHTSMHGPPRVQAAGGPHTPTARPGRARGEGWVGGGRGAAGCDQDMRTYSARPPPDKR